MEILSTFIVTLQSKLMTKVMIQAYANVRNRSVCDPDVVPKETYSKGKKRYCKSWKLPSE